MPSLRPRSDLPTHRGVLEARLEMRPAGGLDLDVPGLGIRSPEWLPELQGDDGAFHRDFVRVRLDSGTGGVVRLDDVAAGTWRLRDDWSGCVSETVRVEAAGARACGSTCGISAT